MRILIMTMLALFRSSSRAFVPTVRSSMRMMSTAAEENKKAGTVKWFNPVKGFGFIRPMDGGNDVFVHQTEIYAKGFRSLADGEPVEYEVDVDGNGRERAIAVTGPDGVYVQGTPPPRREDDMDFE